MNHLLEVRGDTLFVAIRGVLDDDLIRAIFLRIEAQILDRHPYYFLLAESHQMTGFPAAARREVSSWQHGRRSGGNAVVGAGLLARAAMTMVVRELSLIQRAPLPLAFFSLEEEAVAWLALCRRELSLTASASAASPTERS